MNVIKLAERNDDSRSWSVADCLRDMLAEIESGKIAPTCVAVHYWTPSEADGRVHHGFHAAGLTYEGHLALLALAQQKTLDEWQGD